MNATETRFILRARRADGRYPADDPLFADALAAAARAPELAAWLTREERFDAAFAARLEAVPPPAGLREAILVGARASRLRRRWWQSPGTLAAAAAVITLAFALPAIQRRDAPSLLAVGDSLAQFVLHDLATRPHGHNYGPALAAVESGLGARARPLTAGLDVTTDQLRAAGCAAIRFGEREVFEVCFQRDGAWYHLYVARRDRATPGAAAGDRRPVFVEQDQLAAVAWFDGEHEFALVTRSGLEALKRVV